ncbi:MAG: hydrolase [Haloplasmataceae bacterium]|jgi:8-oxo-dGTP diphosphatase|nr:hydrolase [Haloplasmataceae bacterium]
MKRIEVVAAIFIKDNKVFCAQRANKGPLGLKWEFPGGKIEVNETREEALKREIKEELDTQISVDKLFMTIEHQYETFHITMHTFLCSAIAGNLTLSEHVNSCWLSKNDIHSLDWAAADMPIVDKLYEFLN